MKKIPLRNAVLLMLLVSGIVVQSAVSSSTVSSPQPWLWPPAPEKPRVQHVKTFVTPDNLDIKKGFFSKVWDFVAGKDTIDRIVAPQGVVSNGRGKVYVADWGGKAVHYFDFDRKKYDKFSKTREGYLVSPVGIALDEDDFIYVSDSAKRRIFVFEGNKNKRVIGNASLLRPTGIAINKKEKLLYVVDTAGHRVDVFGLYGEKSGSFGKRGARDGEFNFPTHIAVDASGQIYVMDSLNFRVQIFDKTGKFLSKFGTTGTGIHDFIKPKGIAVDSQGHIWVSDSIRNSIQVFNRDGKLLLIFGMIGTGPGEFNLPAGLFIDEKDRLYVADTYNYRVQAFQYLTQ